MEVNPNANSAHKGMAGMDEDSTYAEHAPMVAGICWRILGHRADAEEAAQEAFLQACQLSRAEPVRHWPGLLRRLATTCALQRLRQRRAKTTSDVEQLVSREVSPSETIERRELETRLRNAVALLPAREAVVFCLRYFEGLAPSEIAATLGVPYGSVTSALYRARRQLEPQFADLLTGDERR